MHETNPRHPWEIEDWQKIPYEEALQRMRARVSERIAGQIEDRLILCEHPAVITLGRRPGAHKNILHPRDIPIVEAERGGDVTYHGPGQLVVYPILLLREGERDLHRYLRNLEEIVIRVLYAFDLKGGRSGPTGVWVGERKIASIGVAARRWVVFHGLALNVDLDLTVFEAINPCGLEARVMTSMARELGFSPPWEEVKRILSRAAGEVLGRG